MHNLGLHQHVRRLSRCSKSHSRPSQGPQPTCSSRASEAGSLASPTPAAKILLLDSHSSTADDEYGEKSVSVSLDGQEAEITFIDHPSNEMSVREPVKNVLVDFFR